MKCICGYEHESGIDDEGEWQDNLIGDAEFIRIEGTIFRKYVTNGTYLGLYEDVDLFACPKCGTVRMENKI